MVKEILSALRHRNRYLKDEPILDASYVVIDTELTGLNERKDTIVSIGAIRMKGNRIIPGEHIYYVVRPEKDLSKESILIHGITPGETLSGIEISEALSGFKRFIGEDIVIGHCVSIDITFLNKELKRHHLGEINNPLIDTWVLYEWLKRRFPEEKCLSTEEKGLYHVSRCFGITVENTHNALMDAFITAQFFQRLNYFLIRIGIETTRDLLRVGHAFKGGDRFKDSEIHNF